MMKNKMSANAPEKAKNLKASLGKLLKFCRGHYFWIIFAVVLAGIGSVVSIISPSKLEDITNAILAGKISKSIDMNLIWNITYFLIILFSVGALAQYFQGFIMATVTQKVSNKLRKKIDFKIDKVPLKYFDSTTYGNVLSRITNDVDMISQSLNSSITTLVSAGTLLLGSVIMMFVTNWILAISAILASLIGFGIMSIIATKSQKYFRTQQKKLGELNGHIEEVYSGISIVKVNNASKEMEEKFNKQNNDLFDSAWKSQFLSGLMMPIMAFVGNLGYVVVCVVGVILALNEVITFGVVVAFMMYVRLFTQPLSQLSQCLTNLLACGASSERVFDFLEIEEMEDESNKTIKLEVNAVKGDVSFKNVSFGYSKDKIIIKDFNADIKSGQKVAIVGPTGAGKTTLVNLLMRFYEVNDGEIFIDGISIKDLTRNNVHRLFSLVLQDTWLFEGTVLENIRYNTPNVSDEQVIEICKICGLDHFIKTLQNGYNTVLNDQTAISAGQKQLFTIARAMVQNAPLLILDEATSSIDTRSELLIQNAMDELSKGKTSFVIAHRLSTIKNADLILVLKDGNIIEQGSHKDLIEKKGFYFDLYNSQFDEN